MLTIFIRVNSGGAQLSHSDLLMSILTKSFNFDIRETISRITDDYSRLGFGDFGRDQLLKSCLVLTDLPNRFIVTNFNKKNIKEIEGNWDNITSSVSAAISLLRDMGYAGCLSQSYTITAIAYFINQRKRKLNTDDISAIRRFTQLVQIQNYFSSALDTKLNLVIDVIKTSKTFAEVNAKLAKNDRYPLRLVEEDIEGLLNLQYGRGNVFAVLQILYPDLKYKDSSFHIDHIYPKSKFTSSNKKLPAEYRGRANYLFNLQLLEGRENQEKLNKDPAKWLEKTYQSSAERNDYKRRNHIAKDSTLEWSDIAKFESSRERLITAQLRRFVSASRS
jgi:hypothetical protein